MKLKSFTVQKYRSITGANDGEANFAVCQGLNESELEDLYDTAIYRDLLFNLFRVSIDSPRFKSRKKWSQRIADCFAHCGKQWNDRLKAEVKMKVAEAVAAAPAKALNQHHKSGFESLINGLDDRLRARREAQQ
jgi:hypothetical protein